MPPAHRCPRLLQGDAGSPFSTHIATSRAVRDTISARSARRDDGPMPEGDVSALARNFEGQTPPPGTPVTHMAAPEPRAIVLDERVGRFLWVRPLDEGEEPPKDPIMIGPGDVLVPFTPIHSTSVHSNDIVGDRTGFMFGVLVVEVSRDDEARVLVVRSRLLSEPESGRVRLPMGYTLHVPEGALTIELERIDQMFEPDEDGYKPLSNTIWTWMAIGPSADTQELTRYLFAAARRLDTSYRGFARVRRALTELDNTAPGPHARKAVFEIVGDVEIAVIALGRVVDMAVGVGEVTKVPVSIPKRLVKVQHSLIQIRNAYEHIDERARGRVRKRPHPDALSIFDWTALLESGVIRYGAQQLSLDDAFALLSEARTFLKQVAGRPDFSGSFA